MKILVLGAGGMAGHVIATYLRERGHDVDTLSSGNGLDEKTVLMDVTNADQFKRYLNDNLYDVVVNCIGILVKQSDERKDLSTFLNSYLPHMLEQYYTDAKVKVIHLSTDCVFSGKNAPYYEDSKYDGESFYDRSKALGEIKNTKDLTFRMSIVGPEINRNGVGLFHWFMKQRGEINGYSNVMWTGVTTIELARAIDAAISQDLSGLYHLVPSNNISKYNLLQLFKRAFDKNDINIIKSYSDSIDKSLINTRKDFEFSVSNYETMVIEMKEWINKHKNLYPHYVNKK